MAPQHPRRAPYFDTLERVMEHSIVVDGVGPSRRRVLGVTPREWIHAAGDTFVVARVQSDSGDPDDDA